MVLSRDSVTPNHRYKRATDRSPLVEPNLARYNGLENVLVALEGPLLTTRVAIVIDALQVSMRIEMIEVAICQTTASQIQLLVNTDDVQKYAKRGSSFFLCL